MVVDVVGEVETVGERVHVIVGDTDVELEGVGDSDGECVGEDSGDPEAVRDGETL